MKKPSPAKLTLAKTTLKNLVVKTGVQTGAAPAFMGNGGGAPTRTCFTCLTI
jgi:hypothetical protein